MSNMFSVVLKIPIVFKNFDTVQKFKVKGLSEAYGNFLTVLYK